MDPGVIGGFYEKQEVTLQHYLHIHSDGVRMEMGHRLQEVSSFRIWIITSHSPFLFCPCAEAL